MLIGYARVSTLEQNLELQVTALNNAECGRVFEEKISGSNPNKPILETALSHLREGDTFVVWKLDRLGRSVRDLIEFVGELEKRGVNFRSLTDNIDTGTPSGRFFFHMMASLAQMERELIIERTKAGLNAARNSGRKLGRKSALTPQKLQTARKMLASGIAPAEVAEHCGCSIPTLYRHLPAKNRSELLSN